jgi:hypothetical protein
MGAKQPPAAVPSYERSAEALDPAVRTIVCSVCGSHSSSRRVICNPCCDQSYRPVFGLLLPDRPRIGRILRTPHNAKEEVDDESWCGYPQIELGGDTGITQALR